MHFLPQSNQLLKICGSFVENLTLSKRRDDTGWIITQTAWVFQTGNHPLSIHKLEHDKDHYENGGPVCFAHSSTQASGFSRLPRDPNKYVQKSKALAAARVNFQCGASPDGETKPSNMPAMIRIGMIPTTSRTASAPARASESRRECRPGKSRPRAMMNPAPPAIKIAGNSSTP